MRMRIKSPARIEQSLVLSLSLTQTVITGWRRVYSQLKVSKEGEGGRGCVRFTIYVVLLLATLYSLSPPLISRRKEETVGVMKERAVQF